MEETGISRIGVFSPYFPPERLVSGREKNGTNFGTNLYPSNPAKVACFPRRALLFKTKKHVKPLIYKHFTWYILEAPPRLELGNKDFADGLADARWVS